MIIGRTISHYEILEEVGDGGMGTVYKALDTKLQVHRALKFIHPHLVTDTGFKERFIQEAQAASSLDHPNLCSIHEVDETPAGRPFICMTFYEGETLSKRLEAGPLPPVEVFRIAYSVASGLRCAHQNGIIHRDIKPGNIMITGDGYTKILDFGLAKLAGMASLTRTGQTLGTVKYMSPEQAGGAEADHRSDIWALGVIMYEMATGHYPFPGGLDPAVLYSIVNVEPDPPHMLNQEVPEALSAVIEKCLEKDPTRRYQSCADLLQDLGALAHTAGWGSTLGEIILPVSSTGSGIISRKPKAWGRTLLVVGLLAVVVAGLLWWRSRPPDIYTTELRLAVMPLENQAHFDRNLITAGMTNVVYHILDRASREHDSMWVVPNRLVEYAELGETGQALGAFGVNRVITGGLQRFEGGEALLLSLRDAESLEQLVSVRVPFDPSTPAFGDSLPGALMMLIGMEPARPDPYRDYLPQDGKAVASYLAGQGALHIQNHADAAVQFSTVTGVEAGFAMGWNGLGRAQWQEYVRTGQDSFLASAEESLQKAIAAGPDIWWPRFRLGEVLRYTGRPDQALEVYGEALERDPGNQEISRGRSRVFKSLGRFAESADALEAAINRRSDYFEAPRVLAVHYYHLEVEEETCLKLLDRTLTLAPDDQFALNVLGAVLIRQGKYDLAREPFERAFSLAPKCETCSNMGLVLFHEGKYRESASFYELALEYCDQDDLMTWANWARALYWVEGGREESLEKFEKAIALAWEAWAATPGDPYILGDLIDFHAMSGDQDMTRRLIATADSLGSDDSWLLLHVGTAYELLGERNSALRYLTRSIREGMAVEQVKSTVELADLVEDPRFVRMVAATAGTEDDKAEEVE